MGKGLERHFSKKDIQMAKKKKTNEMMFSVTINKMQIKFALQYLQ